jgi:hypothetical protein
MENIKILWKHQIEQMDNGNYKEIAPPLVLTSMLRAIIIAKGNFGTKKCY